MRITMVGTGYVGLVSGTCFSQFGIEVVCIDQDQKKIDLLNDGHVPIHEPGLKALIDRNVAAGRLSFRSDIDHAVGHSDAIFLAVGTPTCQKDGRADLSYVYAAAKDIAAQLSDYTVIVNKSTVPVGTGRCVADIIKKNNPDADFDIVSNPEFLREGSAIEDFTHPDRVVIGVRTERARQVMKKLYRPLEDIETPILFTGVETAELIKYAANAFLATKVTFINEMADLCEKIGVDIHDIAQGIGLDKRIGTQFLRPGPGYGGSCLPKDTLALTKTARDENTPLRLVEHVIQSNHQRTYRMAERIIQACNGSVRNKTLAILGLTFKPNTDDMRNSPSLNILPALQKAGASLRAYDPKGMQEARHYLRNITWCKDAYEAMENADILVILTEWDAFRALDMERVKELLKEKLIIDLRNMYDPPDMRAIGLGYVSIGRPASTDPVLAAMGSPL